MSINTSGYLNHNGFSISQEFHSLMEQLVIPSTSLQSETFWNAFVDVLTTPDTDGTECITTTDTLCNQSSTEISVSESSRPTDIAPAWGSLYQALYSDTAIPHSAGLKPGSGLNAARRNRVIRCAKDFLDKTYPLTEGSHRDAVSYMVYFQNLLVILADGSTTGLQYPKQFVGKNGPADNPDSILLEHNHIHTEIIFDCNGRTGCNDLAAIEDIQLEAVNYSLFNLQADSTRLKCTTYKNWMQIVKSRHCKTFSNQNGDHSLIDCKNWAITTSAKTTYSDSACTDSNVMRSNTLVLNRQGTPVPEATIDVLTAAIINSVFTRSSNQLNIFTPTDNDEINASLISRVQQMLALITGSQNSDPLSAHSKTDIKVFTATADTPPQTKSRSDVQNLHTRGPAKAMIRTMHSQGYNVNQTAAM